MPDSTWYGAQTARALENFPISGKTAHPALIRAFLKIKAAAAVANRDCGAVSPAIADAIVQAVEQLDSLDIIKWPEVFCVDWYQAGAGTNLHMNVNEVIAICAEKHAQSLSIHPNDHVNRSQSTNDVFPTAMRLALLEASRPLVAGVFETSRILGKHANDWRHLLKAGRTHLRDAVPMTLGQEFSGYAHTVHRCGAWLEGARAELREIGLGASAVGNSVNVPKEFREIAIRLLRKSTGEDLRPAPNLFDATQSQAPVSYYSSMLRVFALELTRICNDLRLLASGPRTGLGEIELRPVQPGSSIMPGKVNPSVLEMMNQVAFAVLGYDQSVAFAMQAGQLELNVMMPLMASHLLEATQILTRGIERLNTLCLLTLKPNPPRLQTYFESTSQIATLFSPRLGYDQTASLVAEAEENNCSLVQLIRDKGILPPNEIQEILDQIGVTYS